MASIGVNIKFTGYTGFLIVKAKEASNPAAYVFTSDAIAFDVDQILDIPDINPVTHIVEFWRSNDGTTLDELLRTWAIDAGIFDGAEVIQYDYVVGRGHTNVTEATGADVWADPVQDDTTLHDARLNGINQDAVRIESRGYGKYRKDEFEMATGGGITLLGGLTFGETGNTFSITVYIKVPQNTTAGPTGNGDYNDVNVITADGDFGETYYRNNNYSGKTGTILTTTFPNFTLIPNTKAKFICQGGTQRYWALQLDAGNTVRFRGHDENIIWLAQGEMIELVFKDAACYIVDDTISRRIGERYYGDQLELNSLLRDGIQYNIADYPRVYYWYIARLNAGQIKTEAQWATTQDVTYILNEDSTVQETRTISPNKGFWAVDTLAGKFRTPDSRNNFVRTLKTFDLVDASDIERTSNKPGAYQIDVFKAHAHKESLWNESGNGNEASGGNFNEGNYNIKKAGGTETRPQNEGLIALVGI